MFRAFWALGVGGWAESARDLLAGTRRDAVHGRTGDPSKGGGERACVAATPAPVSEVLTVLGSSKPSSVTTCTKRPVYTSLRCQPSTLQSSPQTHPPCHLPANRLCTWERTCLWAHLPTEGTCSRTRLALGTPRGSPETHPPLSWRQNLVGVRSCALCLAGDAGCGEGADGGRTGARAAVGAVGDTCRMGSAACFGPVLGK